jgi:small conductance mechanosensitive channel
MSLHRDGIEIVSPAFMNQRPSPAEERFIPPEIAKGGSAGKGSVEEIIFDKAEEAERRELEKLQLTAGHRGGNRSPQGSGESERTRLQGSIEQAKSRLDELERQAGG